MARHDEKTSVGREKILFRGDTGDRLAALSSIAISGLRRSALNYVFFKKLCLLTLPKYHSVPVSMLGGMLIVLLLIL